MKRCSRCGITKPSESFNKEKAAKDGLQSRCRSCANSGTAAWRIANADKVKEYNDAHYDSAYHARRYQHQRDRLLCLCSTYRASNPTKRRAILSASKQKHRSKVLADTRFRQTQQINATPAWADRRAIEAIYREAARLTIEIGIPHQVDHFYPLRGKTCCGLHVENNLQIVTAAENMAKGNRMPVEVMC